MCLMCDMTGRDHFHISPREYRDFRPDDGSGPQGYRPSTQDTNTSVKTTLNFNSGNNIICLLYTSPSPRDRTRSRMPSSA